MADEGKISIRVEGLDEAMRSLMDLAAKLPDEADKIIEDRAEEIFAVSQQIVPVDTGTLQRSGSHTHTKLKSEVGYNTPYAVFVHDGTSRQAPQPYLLGAVQIVLPKLVSDLEKLGQI